MESFFQDLKHSLRMFRQSPAFSFAAVAALALGIGANTTSVSVVNAALLSPLDLYEPDRVVQVRVTSPQGNNPGGSPAKCAHCKQWCAGKDAWSWASRQRTQQERCGVPGLIYLDVATPGPRVVQFLMREDGFELDRFALTIDAKFDPAVLKE